MKHRVKRMRAWVVVDPYCASSSDCWLVRSFDTKPEAETWLAKKVAGDNDGYAGCEVLSKEDALRSFAPNM